MIQHRYRLSMALHLCLLSTVIACSPPQKKCDPGQTRECPCAASSEQGIQICQTDGLLFSPCACRPKGQADVPSKQMQSGAAETTSTPMDEPFIFEPEKPIALPPPRTNGGMPLMSALNARRSSREYSDAAINRQTLSDMLWAAWGINRKDLGKRTAPSAMNWQDMEVYVALEQGLFAYDPAAHSLVPRVGKDIRAQTGKQPFVGTAPVNLIYVSDLSKMKEAPEHKKQFYAGAHAGFAAQNVYLYCASEGLGTVVRAYFDSEQLAAEMQLKDNLFISLAQTVGRVSTAR